MASLRRNEISLLNVLFCSLVIFIHIISYPVSEFLPNTFKFNLVAIPQRLASFVVQGFLMLSGIKLFLNSKDDVPYFKYLKSRFKAIIIPYAVCFCIYYLCYIKAFGYPLDIKYIVSKFVLGSLVYHLYYIVILVQFDILFPIWKKIINKCSPMLIIPIVLVFTIVMELFLPQIITIISPQTQFIYNDRLFSTYLIYWIIGCYIGKYYNDFESLLKSQFTTITILYTVSLVSVSIVTYCSINGLADIYFNNIIHDIYIIYTFIFLYGVAIKLSPLTIEKLSVLKQIDRASYYIYLYHVMVLMFANKLLEILGICAMGPATVLRFLIVYIVTPSLSVAYIAVKRKLFPKKNKHNTNGNINPKEYEINIDTKIH